MTATTPLRFLIIDGYPKPSRDEFDTVGATLAWKLYAQLLRRHLPDAEFDVLLPSDPGADLPTGTGLDAYHGILWTGCNLTIFETHEARVSCQIELAKEAFARGIPSYGSCWGLQMAVVAAGGEVKPNPRGREMGIARKIHLTPAGQDHPFFDGKPAVFDGFISHVDEVTHLPAGAQLLASNDFTHVQAVAVTHQKGTFWATQYHPEYDLHEMARLIAAREPKLLPEGFFANAEELRTMVDRLEALSAEPATKSLRWQLGIDDDLIEARIREAEFANWVNRLVLPTVAAR